MIDVHVCSISLLDSCVLLTFVIFSRIWLHYVRTEGFLSPVINQSTLMSLVLKCIQCFGVRGQAETLSVLSVRHLE